MTRINLIADERRAASTRRSFAISEKVTLLGSVILLTTGLLVGWRYEVLAQQEQQLTGELEVARREEARLAAVLAQVAEFERRRAQLQERVALIDELRRGQTAPVHLIG